MAISLKPPTDWDAEYRRRLALTPTAARAMQRGATGLRNQTQAQALANTTLGGQTSLNRRLNAGVLNQRLTPTYTGTAAATVPSYAGLPNPGSTSLDGAYPGIPTTGQTPGSVNTTPPGETPPTGSGVSDNPYGGKFGAGAIWNSGKPVTSNGGWANTISDLALDQVLGNAPQSTMAWAAANKYGRGVEGALLRYADPTSYALLQEDSMLAPTGGELAGFMGGFNQAAMQSTGGRLINPRAVIQRVLGATGTAGEKGADALGAQLYGNNADNPAGQVDTTLKFLASVLTGTMPQQTMNAYLSMLERYGREFIQWKSTPAAIGTAKNFGAYVLDRTNGTGGV